MTKASHAQQVNVAHPSFVNIINNISPDEASLLKSIRDNQSIPFVEVRLKSKNSRELLLLNPMQIILPCLASLKFRNNVPAYFSNLEGLEVVHIRQDRWLAAEDAYSGLEEHSRKQYSGVGELNDREPDFGRGAIDTTRFGSLFLQACFTSAARRN